MTDLSRFNYKKLSLEDRMRLREVRKELQRLWFPPMERHIKEWRRKTGINSSIGLKVFSNLKRKEKEQFFADAHTFIRLIKNARKAENKPPISVYSDLLKKAYSLFGINARSTIREIQKRYRQLVLQNHPDRGGNAETFLHIMAAYRSICRYKNKLE